MFRNEGVRAVYKGCSALMIGFIAKGGVRFLSYDTIKNAFANPKTGTLSPLRNMLAEMSAGVVASVTASVVIDKPILISDIGLSKPRYPISYSVSLNYSQCPTFNYSQHLP
jgi:hypothetical protein